MRVTGKDELTAVETRLRELTLLLAEMKSLHENLLSVSRRKLEAMRQADAQSLDRASRDERTLADRIRDREGLRVALMTRVGEQMGVEEKQARKMSLGELARRVAEPVRTQLTILGNELRKIAADVARINRICALVSQEMLRHFRNVYEAMTQHGETRDLYGKTGRPQYGAPAALIDTTG